MTDREKMEEVVRLDGRCEDCSKMVWKCNNCPIEKDCQDCSIQTYGRSLRLAKEWIKEDDMKKKIIIGVDMAKGKDKTVTTGVQVAPNLKVGDKVKIVIDVADSIPLWRDFANSKKIHTISKVTLDGDYKLEGSDCCFFL